MRSPRRARRLGLAIAAALGVASGVIVAIGGCTLLITFDDKPTKDAGVDVSPRPPVTTGTPPTPTPPAPPPTRVDGASPDRCDHALDSSRVKGCDRFVPDAQVCADNAAFEPYPFPRPENDVVTCRNADAVCVEHCPAACAHLPAGFPDQCDRCVGRPDGTYCGSELGWVTRDSDLLVHCSGERLADPAPAACARGCAGGGGQGTAECDP